MRLDCSEVVEMRGKRGALAVPMVLLLILVAAGITLTQVGVGGALSLSALRALFANLALIGGGVVLAALALLAITRNVPLAFGVGIIGALFYASKIVSGVFL